MTNLPPPNHATNLPKDELINPEPDHLVPDHAPMYVEEDLEEDLQEDPEENPIKQLEPKPEPNHMNGFALHPLPQQENNMNGWLINDDDEEEEIKEMNDDEMEVDDNDEDDAEVIHLYEEADPFNRSPPKSDEETEFATTTPVVSFDSEDETEFAVAASPVTSSILQSLPHICQFTSTFYIREGSSAKAFNAENF
nr:hypothetical protein [Tanacetum cinerariifolium]